MEKSRKKKSLLFLSLSFDDETILHNQLLTVFEVDNDLKKGFSNGKEAIGVLMFG